MPHRFVTLAAALSLTVCAGAEASGIAEAAGTDAARTAAPPIIDGRLDDQAWELATPRDDFTQALPNQGAAPSERTEFRVLYDDERLYIGVRCFDSGGRGAVIAREMRPDVDPSGDDNINIAIDTNGDGRTGYFFRLGAAGGKSDGIIEDNDLIGLEWDGLWTGRVSVDDEGWSAEFAIPLSTVAFDPRADTWGINLSRNVGRLNETIRWRNAVRGRSFTELSQAGELRGIVGLESGSGLRFQPFITAETDLDSGDVAFDPGFDLFYRITPTVNASVTVNTDFAETEVDDRIVNLTRFPVFFPEQRDFFLEENGIFQFGGVRQSPLPFFSRRIGIVGGEEKGILAGLRLTGKADGTRFGVLNVQMDRTDELGAKNLSVVRVRRPVLGESNAGFIITNGDPGRRGNNTLFGADINFRKTAEDPDGITWTGSAFVQGTVTDTTGVDDDNSDTTAVGGRFRAGTPLYSFDSGFARIGENYNPALGFVGRRGRWETFGGASRTWVTGGRDSFISEIELGVRHNTFFLIEGEPDTSEVTFFDLGLQNFQNDSVSLRGEYFHENLEEPFEIIDGVVLPVDRYNNVGVAAGFRTSDIREVSVDGDIRARQFFNGSRVDYEIGGAWRPSPRFFAEGEFEFRDVKTDQGDFVVRIASGRASVQLSPELSISSTVQYDSLSDEVGINARLRYEFDPGQEIFVVLNEGIDATDGEFESLDSEVIFKLGLTFQF